MEPCCGAQALPPQNAEEDLKHVHDAETAAAVSELHREEDGLVWTDDNVELLLLVTSLFGGGSVRALPQAWHMHCSGFSQAYWSGSVWFRVLRITFSKLVEK